VDWIRHLDLLNDWDLDLLVDGIFLDMMVMDGVNVVWDRDLDVMAVDWTRKQQK
jgi:hypothetical protein